MISNVRRTAERGIQHAALGGAVLTHLRAYPDGLSAGEIGRALGGLSHNLITGACYRLEAQGAARGHAEPAAHGCKPRVAWYPLDTPWWTGAGS